MGYGEMAKVFWRDPAFTEDVFNAANYVGGVAPVNGDTFVANSGNSPIGAHDSSSIAFEAFVVIRDDGAGNGYSGKIGVDQNNTLIIDANTVSLGITNTHCFLTIQNGGAAFDLKIYDGQPATTGQESTTGLHVKTTDVANIEMFGGVAFIDDSSVLGTNFISGGTLWVGSSVTGTIVFDVWSIGILHIDSAFTTGRCLLGGTVFVTGSASSVTTYTNTGTTFWLAGGTLGTLRCEGGTMDESANQYGLVVTNSTFLAGTNTFKDTVGGTTFTNDPVERGGDNKFPPGTSLSSQGGIPV